MGVDAETCEGFIHAAVDLTTSADFKRAVKGLDTKVMAFSHFDWGGVIDQITANGKLIASNVAPPPADMKGPKMPEFPEEWTQEANEKYDKDMEAYWKAKDELRGKHAKWRQDNAEANAKAFKEILDSLKIFGSTCGSTTYENCAVITTTVSRVNLGAAQ